MSDTAGNREIVTPADLARRLGREGVIMNAATAWAFVRARVAEDMPERIDPDRPTALSLTEEEFNELLDELLLQVDRFRSMLSQTMVEAERLGSQISHQT